MPTINAMQLSEYIDNIIYFRKEFYKRSVEYQDRSNEIKLLMEHSGLLLNDEFIESMIIHDFIKKTSNDNNKILISEVNPVKEIEFTFKINPYITIVEFRKLFELFRLESEKLFKNEIKYGYTKFQADYKYDKNGKINYFKIAGYDDPFSHWRRILKALDLKHECKSNNKIGLELNDLYRKIEGRALLRAVSSDLKEAHRLIRCAKYDSFPNEPFAREKRSYLIPPLKPRPPKDVVLAFQKKMLEPDCQEALKNLRERNLAKRRSKL